MTCYRLKPIALAIKDCGRSQESEVRRPLTFCIQYSILEILFIRDSPLCLMRHALYSCPLDSLNPIKIMIELKSSPKSKDFFPCQNY